MRFLILHLSTLPAEQLVVRWTVSRLSSLQSVIYKSGMQVISKILHGSHRVHHIVCTVSGRVVDWVGYPVGFHYILGTAAVVPLPSPIALSLSLQASESGQAS